MTQAEAQVSQKEAAVSVAKTNLDYTIIRSPTDGTVVARNVELGQTVAASLQAPTIFTIAQDLTKMLVYTKTDESDVGNIRPGRAVTFKVDAFPKDVFRGVVRQVRMNPTTIQNVVTYDTIIEFDNPDLKLFPGMTAYVTIPVATVESVLKVPNTALRYKPPLSLEEIERGLREIWNRGEPGVSRRRRIRQPRRAGGRGGWSARGATRHGRRVETALGHEHDGAGQDLARHHRPLVHGSRRPPQGNSEGRRRAHHSLGARQAEDARNAALARL